jgi:hypothetical protein
VRGNKLILGKNYTPLIVRNRRLILIGIFKKSAGKNPREAERRAKQEERRQRAQARGQSAVK